MRLTGKNFGRLKVIATSSKRKKDGHAMCECRCACGTVRLAAISDLRSGHLKSCGLKCGLLRVNMPKPAVQLCNFCRQERPFTDEFFPLRKRRVFGLDTKCRQCVNTDARAVNKPERDRLRIQILTHYGRNGELACTCCGEAREEFLTLDHVNGNGKEDRKKYPATMLFRRLRRNNYPTGYRTLCYNCNCSLGIRGYCPHENEKL